MREQNPEHSTHILNINDDEATRYMVSRILRRAGYRVVEAGTGLDALQLACENPALIVLDVKLPDISGLDVCRRLKATPETARIPILQTSATFVSTERKVEGLESGADGYLAQPIEPPELIATVRALLRTRRAEDSVMKAAREWAETFDAIRDPVATLDGNGNLVRANQAFQALFDERVRAGDTYPMMLARAFPDTQLPALEHETPQRISVDARLAATEGEEPRYFQIVLDPVRDGRGRPERWVLVFTDVTNLKRLEALHRQRLAELLEADRRKDEFLAMLAHELRNPLNAIAVSNSLQDRVSAQDERSQRLRSMIAKQTKHLARLVDDLLEISRVSRGQIQLKTELADLVAVVESAERACRPFLDARHQTLHMALPEGRVVGDIDALRLEQALVNVISNASKFSEVGSPILLSLSLDDVGGSGPHARALEAVIRVRDQGIGIPPERLGDVFELFVQIDQSLARSRGGLGIGLTITRRLVEMHGGRIVARSEGIGRGTEIEMRLPVPAQHPGLVPLPTPAPHPQRWDQGRRVLVIEDDVDTAEALQTLLEEWGHRVTVAFDGASGLEQALKGLHEVAFVDIGLPGIDGYQVARNLRATDRLSGLTLVALTGYGRPEDRARALEAGFDLHIVKPFDAEQIARVLDDRSIAGHKASA